MPELEMRKVGSNLLHKLGQKRMYTDETSVFDLKSYLSGPKEFVWL
jgi:hypothetical protein